MAYASVRSHPELGKKKEDPMSNILNEKVHSAKFHQSTAMALPSFENVIRSGLVFRKIH